MKPHQKTLVRAIVDLYIDVIMADEESIALESRSLLGALVDFKGEIPRSSGFSGFCKLAGKVDRMRSWTDAHKMSVVVMARLTAKQRKALILDRVYRNRFKVCTRHPMGKYWNDEECAIECGCSVEAFWKRVSDGYISVISYAELTKAQENSTLMAS